MATPSRQNLLLIGAVIGAVAILGGVWWYRSLRDEPLVVRPPEVKPKTEMTEVEADPSYVVVGGVRRKASDVHPTSATDPAGHRPEFDPGTAQPVPANANPSVASVAEALRDKNHPERLSPLIPPKPFDREAFQRNPRAYLDVIEPARVFQTAQPGPGVEVLRQLSPRFPQIKQGESTKLRVKAVPQAPVTFHSFDLGRFAENQMTTVTVQANGEGIAEAEFVGSAGTYNNVDILAGSPLTTGQVKFVVYVEVPVTQRRPPDDSKGG